MSHRVAVGGDEFASLVFIDAKLGVLDLVVVDIAIEANNDGPHVLIDLQPPAGSHVGLLALVSRPAEPRHVDQIQLLPDANLSDDVHLLPALLELGKLEVGRGGEGRGEDGLGGYIEAEAIELLLVSRARLGGIVGHEVHLLTEGLELVESFRNTRNKRVSLDGGCACISFHL